MTEQPKPQEKPAAPAQQPEKPAGEALLEKFAKLGEQAEKAGITQDHTQGCGCGCSRNR